MKAALLEPSAVFAGVTALGTKGSGWECSIFSRLNRSDWFGKGAGARFGGLDKLVQALVGVNLNALLPSRRASQTPFVKNVCRLFFQHMQIPRMATRSSWAL
jgi:hypothetical protein